MTRKLYFGAALLSLVGALGLLPCPVAAQSQAAGGAIEKTAGKTKPY